MMGLLLSILKRLFGNTLLVQLITQLLSGVSQRDYLNQILPTVERLVNEADKLLGAAPGSDKHKHVVAEVLKFVKQSQMPIINSLINTAIELVVQGVRKA